MPSTPSTPDSKEERDSRPAIWSLQHCVVGAIHHHANTFHHLTLYQCRPDPEIDTILQSGLFQTDSHPPPPPRPPGAPDDRSQSQRESSPFGGTTPRDSPLREVVPASMPTSHSPYPAPSYGRGPGPSSGVGFGVEGHSSTATPTTKVRLPGAPTHGSLTRQVRTPPQITMPATASEPSPKPGSGWPAPKPGGGAESGRSRYSSQIPADSKVPAEPDSGSRIRDPAWTNTSYQGEGARKVCERAPDLPPAYTQGSIGSSLSPSQGPSYGDDRYKALDAALSIGINQYLATAPPSLSPRPEGFPGLPEMD